MSKYSTDTETTTHRLTTQTHQVICEATCKPFVDHRHRHETVHQRVVVVYEPGVGIEVRWEARSDDTEKVPDEWALVERFEARDGYCRRERHPRRRWLV